MVEGRESAAYIPAVLPRPVVEARVEAALVEPPRVEPPLVEPLVEPRVEPLVEPRVEALALGVSMVASSSKKKGLKAASRFSSPLVECASTM